MKRLAISFSGGRTSAVMTKMLMDNQDWWDEVCVTFANTGCEHHATLDFVHECDQRFGWGVVWIEAVVGPPGVGIRHKVVDYQTASRDGQPFWDYCQKHGLPGPSHPQCTSRLKEEPMDSYRHRELGWKRGEYQTAIGIRADEFDRMSREAQERGFIYPLVSAGHTKRSVASEVASWGFDLQIPGDHWGNCVWCWKKSLRKLMTLAMEDAEAAFAFPRRLELAFSRHRQADDQDDRTMFRGRRTTDDIIRMARDSTFTPYRDDQQMSLFDQIGWDELLDTGSACGESCEIGADE